MRGASLHWRDFRSCECLRTMRVGSHLALAFGPVKRRGRRSVNAHPKASIARRWDWRAVAIQHPLGALAHALLLLHLAPEMLRDLVSGNGAADKVLQRGVLRVERGVLIRKGGGDEQPQCRDYDVRVVHLRLLF